MPLPAQYRRAGEGAVASYDFTDIASGTGLVLHYGVRGHTLSGSNTFYALSQDVTYDDSILTSGYLNVATGAVNFDTSEFNLPQIIKGIMYIVGEQKCAAAQWTKFTVQRVRKGTATNLVPPDYSPSVSTNTPFLLTFDIPSTKIKRGDVLRLVVQVLGEGGNTGLNINSESTAHQIFKIFVPFKIDI